jgi:hypothetical protein
MLSDIRLHRVAPVLTAVVLIPALFGCDRKTEQGDFRPQIAPPTVDSQQTQRLFDTIKLKKLGEQWGRVEMRPRGLLVHPGNTPTVVEFNLARRFDGRNLVAFLLPLGEDSLADPKAGTARIRVYCDGKLVAESEINRSTNLFPAVGLGGVSKLKIEADNAGDSAFADGLCIGVQ